jgi:hypothetical protein
VGVETDVVADASRELPAEDAAVDVEIDVLADASRGLSAGDAAADVDTPPGLAGTASAKLGSRLRWVAAIDGEA